MPFNTLLLHSLIHATSVNENGVRAITQQLPGERILFFHMDDANTSRILGVQKGEGVCDYLVLYSKEIEGSGEYKKVICQVELKGKDILHAKGQILDTYARLQRLLKSDPSRPPLQHIVWKAYICFNAHSPVQQTKPTIDELRRNFADVDIVRDKGTDKRENFGEFLRR